MSMGLWDPASGAYLMVSWSSLSTAWVSSHVPSPSTFRSSTNNRRGTLVFSRHSITPLAFTTAGMCSPTKASTQVRALIIETRTHNVCAPYVRRSAWVSIALRQRRTWGGAVNLTRTRPPLWLSRTGFETWGGDGNSDDATPQDSSERAT